MPSRSSVIPRQTRRTVPGSAPGAIRAPRAPLPRVGGHTRRRKKASSTTAGRLAIGCVSAVWSAGCPGGWSYRSKGGGDMTPEEHAEQVWTRARSGLTALVADAVRAAVRHAVQAEREACALLCEQAADAVPEGRAEEAMRLEDAADAIRARDGGMA